MYMDESPPVGGRLIVDDDVRLRKERLETVLNSELLGRITRIVPTSAAPGVQCHALILEMSDMADHFRHGNALRSKRPNKSVVDVNIRDQSSMFAHSVPFGWITLCLSSWG